VTIAIGIIARDGLVIAADTQETVGGHKSDESKLLVANQGLAKEKLGAMAVTGAGDAGYLDSLNQELCAAFLSKKKWPKDSLLRKTKKVVRQFHDDNVVPYAKWPEHDRPQLSLVIAAQTDKINALWSTDRSAVSMAKRYCAVGLGSAYAQVMLRRFWTKMDTVKAASLAAYVIFHVKNTVDGCGKQTQIVILKDGFASWISQSNLNLLEGAFDNYVTHENLMLHFILGLDLRQPNIEHELTVFGLRLKKNREDINSAQEFVMTSYRSGETPVDQPEMKPQR